MESLGIILKKMSGTEPTSDPKAEQEMEEKRAERFNEVAGDLNTVDGYECKLCRNKGFLVRAVQTESGYWETVSRDCKCAEIRRTIKRMEKSGLKNIIRDYTFSKYDDTEAWQKTIKAAAMEYAKNPSGWFFIGGQTGAGKTHICTAICREFLLSGKSVKYMLWRDDIVKIKGCANDAQAYSKLIDEYKRVEVLYIDDLFKTGKGPDGSKQQPTGADINAAFEILNYRYNDPKLVTIVSSECTVNDILDIDEAVGGRIFEKAKVFSLSRDRRKNYRLRGAVEL